MDDLSNENNTETYDYCECDIDEDQFEHENKSIKTSIDKFSCVEIYLKEKRIMELIHFMLTKVVAEAPEKPVLYLEKLLDDCIGFLEQRSSAPVLYESRHLEAMVKSFDPCQRGWLNVYQVQRLYELLGLEMNQNDLEEHVKVNNVMEDLKNKQNLSLCKLLLAGTNNSNYT